jgi:hypothetical protein
MARTKPAKASDPQLVRVPLLNKYKSEVSIDGYSLEGTPDDAIAVFTALKAEFPDKVLRLDWRQAKYEDSYSLCVDEERLETPEEVAKRLEEDAARKQRQADRDRAEYERLAKQFGPK